MWAQRKEKTWMRRAVTTLRELGVFALGEWRLRANITGFKYKWYLYERVSKFILSSIGEQNWAQFFGGRFQVTTRPSSLMGRTDPKWVDFPSEWVSDKQASENVEMLLEVVVVREGQCVWLLGFSPAWDFGKFFRKRIGFKWYLSVAESQGSLRDWTLSRDLLAHPRARATLTEYCFNYLLQPLWLS